MYHVAVIGANFGDEGKGQMVDYFAATRNYSSVIRYNGGSQAGHTVVTPSGEEHIFSQIGSGAFHGLPTHLSRFMLVNPVYFMREYDILSAKVDFRPSISIDPTASIITPWDVEANRKAELSNTIRHGSVGHGINATLTRAVHDRYCLTYEMLERMSHDQIRFILQDIQRVHGFDSWSDSHRAVREDAFISSVEQMLQIVKVRSDNEVCSNPCIFEGAQGLLLDQNSGFFPHVTPSNTGLANVMSILAASPSVAMPVRPVYVTRSYLTRHGRGPMYHKWLGYAQEHSQRPDNIDVDLTNVHNDWQETLRYGRLSVAQLEYAVRRDAAQAARFSIADITKPELAMTWCNVEHPSLEGPSAQVAIQDSRWYVGDPIHLKYVSDGRTRESIRMT
jgi:adenylosuccinate synthase